MSVKHTALVIAFMAAAGLQATQENFSAGSQAVPWLKLNNNARTAAMGGAGAAVADDVNAIAINPAGLASLKGQEVALMHHLYVQDAFVDHVAWGMPLAGKGGLGVSVDYLNFGSVSEIEVTASNTPVEKGSFNPSGLHVDLAYGMDVAAGFSAGLDLKMVSETLYKDTASAFGADLGLLWRHASGLSAGVALQNAGSQMNGANLPMNIKAGAAYKVSLSGENGGALSAALDANIPSADAGATACGLGLEYSGYQMFAVRAGYKLVGNEGAGGLSAGVGLKYLAYGVDYAYVAEGSLGSSHQVSLLMKF